MKNIFDFVCLLLFGGAPFFFDLLFLNTVVFFSSLLAGFVVCNMLVFLPVFVVFV